MVLSAIEERRATWKDINHINLIRTQYSNKIVVHSPSQAIIAPSSKSGRNNVQSGNTKPCRKFNSGKCQFEGHHTFNGVTYKHNCNFCYQQGKQFNHAEVNCNNKNARTIIHSHT